MTLGLGDLHFARITKAILDSRCLDLGQARMIEGES